MKTINLKHIAETADLKINKLGEILFPDNRDSYSAVTRIMRGKGLLNAEQIAKLAEHLNVPIGLLFEDVDWAKSMPPFSRVISFKAYDYTAELDIDTRSTVITKKDAPFFHSIEHDKDVKLSEYLKSLTDLIIKNS